MSKYKTIIPLICRDQEGNLIHGSIWFFSSDFRAVNSFPRNRKGSIVSIHTHKGETTYFKFDGESEKHYNCKVVVYGAMLGRLYMKDYWNLNIDLQSHLDFGKAFCVKTSEDEK